MPPPVSSAVILTKAVGGNEVRTLFSRSSKVIASVQFTIIHLSLFPCFHMHRLQLFSILHSEVF